VHLFLFKVSIFEESGLTAITSLSDFFTFKNLFVIFILSRVAFDSEMLSDVWKFVQEIKCLKEDRVRFQGTLAHVRQENIIFSNESRPDNRKLLHIRSGCPRFVQCSAKNVVQES